VDKKEENVNSEQLKTEAKAAVRKAITDAMKIGMTQPEIIEVLESAIGVLRSGDMR
jgi:DNA-binding transcriptional regulator YhcF (GntR family)